MRVAVVATVVLASLFTLAAVPALQADEVLGIGRRITAELRSIIVEHRETLRGAIYEYKLVMKSLPEEKLQVIKEFIEESRRLRDGVKAEMEALRDQFRAGEITVEEFVSRLRVLTAKLEALGKSSEKFGNVLSELARKIPEAVKEMVEELRRANEDFGRHVAEEARTIGEKAREEVANATQTPGPPEETPPRRGRGANATETPPGNATESSPPGRRGR